MPLFATAGVTGLPQAAAAAKNASMLSGKKNYDNVTHKEQLTMSRNKKLQITLS